MGQVRLTKFGRDLTIFHFLPLKQKLHATKFAVTAFKLIFNPSHPNPGRREKINLNLYFHTSLRWLKRFYEGL